MTTAQNRDASQVVDATGPEWVRDAVFYEVFPDRFFNGDTKNDPAGTQSWEAKPRRESFYGGDIAGLMTKLPYLQDLGVTALYLTPVFKAGTSHRYDTHDYFEIDPRLGDTGLMREFVQEAHARGVRIVLDGVFNHVGDGFPRFMDAIARGSESPYRDWFFIDDGPVTRDPPSYQTCGGAPYLPKLNNANPEVRNYLLRVALHWIVEADIDGWRLDVPWKVPLEFWRALRARVKQAKPDAYLVGEAWWSWAELPTVFDGLMNYRLRNRLLDFCIRDAMDAEDLAIETSLAVREASDACMLNLLGSHDTARLATLAGGDEDRVELAMTALFTFPGTPMLYYGDEVGLEGAEDPDCRRPMVWDETSWRQGTRDLVKRLIALRRESMALRHGSWEAIVTFNRVLVFRRVLENEQVIVVLNAGAARRNVAFDLPLDAPEAFTDALTGDRFGAADPVLSFHHLPAHSALVLVGEGRNGS
jgi:cyclomaltodextrinase